MRPRTSKRLNLCLLVLALLPSGLRAGTDKPYRFAEKPWGLDSPAGRCVVCHSLEKNGPHRVAPNLWGIIGRQKAARSWFNYSAALRAKGGVWTVQELDQFLADANQFAPGSSKSIRVKDADKRRKIIEFLKKLN